MTGGTGEASADGLERIRIVDLQSGDQHVVEQPEPVYATGGGFNAEFDTELYRFTYTSLVSPPSIERRLPPRS